MRSLFVVFLILFSITTSSFGNTVNSDVVLVVASKFQDQPQILTSTDKGNTWEIKPLPALPNHPAFKSIHCSGKGTSAICIAVGDDPHISQFSNAPPVIVVSHDGGETWQSKNIDNWKKGIGKLDRVTCTGQGSNMVCAAAGSLDYNSIEKIPMIVTSFDQGQTWNLQLIGYPYADYISFNSISCTDSGKNALCAAVGNFKTKTSTLTPMLFISQDGGNTWDSKYVKMNNTNVYYLNSVSCTGEQKNSFCAVGGVTTYFSQPQYEFVSVTRDRGNSWTTTSSNPFKSAPLDPGVMTNCIGNGITARCSYAFQNDLRTSADQANTWKAANLPADNLTSISCTGGGALTTCVATSSYGSLLVTHNGGVNWERVNFAHKANSVSCTGDGSSSSVCIVNSGWYITISNNGGQNWFFRTLPNGSGSTTYSIDAVAATGSG